VKRIRSGPGAILAAATIIPLCFATASAQTNEIKFARQFSMGYLQFNVMERRRLVEKHAKAAGLNDVKVVWATFNSPAAMNDALISGSVDIVSGGMPGLLTIWARTRGTTQAVKGVAAFSSQPILLNTRNPKVKSIADFGPEDKIAVPAVKVSIQAMFLQMAAAKLWGPAEYARLDPLTVGMAPPDATIALLSGAAGITSVFSVPPFQTQQLEKEGIRTVLNSYEVFGGPHTFTVAWTSAQFRDKNPVLYRALISAFEEATGIVNAEIRVAAQYWAEDVRSNMVLDKVVAVATGPQVKWTMAPENSLKFAAFMTEVGTLKAKPADWKELFFPEIHGLPGS
jgi:NitT/TauT family transport system substrate-binding protein